MDSTASDAEKQALERIASSTAEQDRAEPAAVLFRGHGSGASPGSGG